VQEVEDRASFLLVRNIAKQNKPLSDSEFMKQCMVDVPEALHQEKKTKRLNMCLSVCLSRRTTVRSDTVTELNAAALLCNV
jgi:hypothetical protein